MNSTTMLEKPHAVCLPFPAQGHINPMLNMAKLLHQRAGFHVTFVNTEFNHNRLLKSRGPNALDGTPSFRFEAIPDGLPESNPDATQDLVALCEFGRKHCSAPFRDLISKLNNTASSNVPPVTCIISDANMICTFTVAEELGIPDVVLWTCSACSFLAFIHYPHLIEKGYSIRDVSDMTSGSLDTVIDWIPGMEGIRLKDFPLISRTIDPNNLMMDHVFDVLDSMRRASAIIINTFEKLDCDILGPLSSTLPPIYTIGPLDLLMNEIKDDGLKSIGSNLWNEEPQCLEWLDTQEPNSVIYVNFGSIAVVTPNQLLEFAWGLANSNLAFLWIIRPDVVAGEMAILPPEFVEETRKRGLIASWCPQGKVLDHPSIGGFLTHCGWNSMLESISSGVPMVCWPFVGDQLTNCWYCCEKWGIGLEIDNDVKRDEVASLVRELVVGVKGKEMKKKAIEWKILADEATQTSSGSSILNLDNIVNEVLHSPRQHQ